MVKPVCETNLRMKLLLDDAPTDGNENQPSTPDPSQPAPTIPTAAPAPPAPPAATTVVRGTKREDEVGPDLVKRNLETRIASLEDENRRLKEVPPVPAPDAGQKKSWIEGGSFFD